MNFRDYKTEGEKWITIISSDYYPDYLDEALNEFGKYIKKFGELLDEVDNSADLLRRINKESGKDRRQYLRIFRKYVSPPTSVEMLKRKNMEDRIIKEFSDNFRDIDVVREQFNKRDSFDEALAALLWEYATRGEKGYVVEDMVFSWFLSKFPKYSIEGPRGAGRDINLQDVFTDYPNKRPVDFIVFNEKEAPIIVGLARYDSDRGGAQEDDRTGGYGNFVKEFTSYCTSKKLSIRILFVNEGPGLLLGSMWDDYSNIEESDGNVKVCTLKMLDDRVTQDWILNIKS